MQKQIVKLLLFAFILFGAPVKANAQLPEWDGYQRTFTPAEETEEYKSLQQRLQSGNESQEWEEYLKNSINGMRGKYYNRMWNGSRWQIIGFDKVPELVNVSYDVTYNYDEAYKMIDLVNEERRRVGVPELKTNDYLMQIAMERAAETALYFDHTRPDGSSYFTKHMFIVGENCTTNADSAMDAFLSWKNSPGHYANMLDRSYIYAGYGMVNGYGVQIFVRGERFWDVGADRHDESKQINISDYSFTKSQTNYKETFTTYVDTELVDIIKESSFTLCNQKGTYDYISGFVPENVDYDMRNTLKVGYIYDTHIWLCSNPKSLLTDGYSLASLTPDILSCSDGKLTALKKGTAKIQVTIGKYSKIIEIGVEENKLEIGYEIEIGKLTYKVDSDSTVVCKAVDDSAKGKIVIPDSIKIEGITYKVGTVGDKAFWPNKNITSITIGKNVTKIGKYAFNGCSRLKKITIKSNKLKYVGKWALSGANRKLVIKVPKKKYKAYKKLFMKSNTGYTKSMKIKK